MWIAGSRVEVVREMTTQALNVMPRAAMAGELVPADYFRRLRPDELARPGRPLELAPRLFCLRNCSKDPIFAQPRMSVGSPRPILP